MQVTSGGPAGGADCGDDLPCTYAVAGFHSDTLEVVVGSDKPVAVIELNSVAATPRMPANRTHNPGIRREDPGAARRCEVLA